MDGRVCAAEGDTGGGAGGRGGWRRAGRGGVYYIVSLTEIVVKGDKPFS